MTNEQIIAAGQQIYDETEVGANTSERIGGVIKGIGQRLATRDTEVDEALTQLGNQNAGIDAKNGYYTNNQAASESALTVTAPGYVLSAGGNIRIKMEHSKSVSSVTLNINNTGAKALYYKGEAVSAENTWEDNEVIVVYYDGEKYLATNSLGGGEIGKEVEKINKLLLGELENKNLVPVSSRKGYFTSSLEYIYNDYGLANIYKIESGKKYILTYNGGGRRSGFADSEGNLVGELLSNKKTAEEVTAPDGATYLFISTYQVDIVVNADVYSGGLNEAKNIGYDNTSSKIPASNVQEAIDSIVAVDETKTINTANVCWSSGVIQSDGTLGTRSDMRRSEPIDISGYNLMELTDIAAYNGIYSAVYDKSFNLLFLINGVSDAADGRYVFTLPPAAKYVIVSYYSGTYPSIILSKKSIPSMAKSAYNDVNGMKDGNMLELQVDEEYIGKAFTKSGTLLVFQNKEENGVVRFKVGNYIGKKVKLSKMSFSRYYMYAFTNNANEIVEAQQTAGYMSSYAFELVIPAGSAYLYLQENLVNGTVDCYASVELTTRDIVEMIPNVADVNSNIRGKKVICFGDSITWYDGHNYNWGKEQGQVANGYESYMRAEGMDVINNGLSGYTLKQILDEGIKAADYSDIDYVTITSGANDARYERSIGQLAEIGSTFENTFIGNLQEAIEYILGQNNRVKILLITPIRGWIYAPRGYATGKLTDGIIPEDYAEAFKKVGELYSLPVCDWYHLSGCNDLTRIWYINDPEPDKTANPNPNDLYSLHPSNAGYKRMAEILIPYLRGM